MQMVAFRAAGSPPPAPDTTPPTAPANLTATPVNATQINLAWTAATDAVGVTGYRVERCQGAGCSTFAQIATPMATTFNDTGLTALTSYSYRVRATDATGNLGPYSNIATATTPALDTTPPTAPTNLTGTPASASRIESRLDRVDRWRRRDRLPGGAMSRCRLQQLCPDRHPDGDDVRRHRAECVHDLPLSGPCHRCGR